MLCLWKLNLNLSQEGDLILIHRTAPSRTGIVRISFIRLSVDSKYVFVSFKFLIVAPAIVLLNNAIGVSYHVA